MSWIKTSDKMPDENAIILFVLTPNEICLGHYFNAWFESHTGIGQSFLISQVKYWMYIPEVPE